jgi:LysM repeat protein
MVPANKTKNDENTTVGKLDSKNNKFNSRKKSIRLYMVKKGDTLFLVAKNNSITVQELLKINNMKITDPLLYGQKIKLP